MRKDDAVLTSPIADPTTSVRIEDVHVVFGDVPSARIVVGWYGASGALLRTEAVAVAPAADGPPQDAAPPSNVALDEMLLALMSPAGNGNGNSEPSERWRRRLMSWLIGFRPDLFGDAVVTTESNSAPSKKP